jgi:hypothetical protein
MACRHRAIPDFPELEPPLRMIICVVTRVTIRRFPYGTKMDNGTRYSLQERSHLLRKRVLPTVPKWRASGAGNS